jgi:hypothetical protein
MPKTTKFTLSAKKKGLSVLLLIVLFTGSHRDAIAATVGDVDNNLSILSIDANGFAVMHGPEKPKSVQETLQAVCVSRGYGDDCARQLLGMAWKESNFIADAKGDYDRRGFPHARGWFQIHYRLHKISVECAEDLTCSANWTIDYLESNSYPKYQRYAIQCHNGCNIENGYAASVLRHGNRLWNSEVGIQVAVK